jgi:hypothetical protein
MAKARPAYNYMHDSDSTALVRFPFGSPKERRQLILGGSDAVSILTGRVIRADECRTVLETNPKWVVKSEVSAPSVVHSLCFTYQNFHSSCWHFVQGCQFRYCCP